MRIKLKSSVEAIKEIHAMLGFRAPTKLDTTVHEDRLIAEMPPERTETRVTRRV